MSKKSKKSKTPPKPLKEEEREPCQLYLITPPRFEPVGFGDTLRAALDAGPVSCLQLRLKNEDESKVAADEVKKAAEILMPIAHEYDVAFLVNDDPVLAHEMGADGVHIGQKDMPYAEARQIVGENQIVGVTCHDQRHLAMEAGEAGADYVAFGAFHPTVTKLALSAAEPDILTWWSELFVVPCVAIGGITTANAAPLVKAGADFLAVSSGVWGFEQGPAAAVKEFDRLLIEESKNR